MFIKCKNQIIMNIKKQKEVMDSVWQEKWTTSDKSLIYYPRLDKHEFRSFLFLSDLKILNKTRQQYLSR